MLIVPLFLKPGWMLTEGQPAIPDEIAGLGIYLKEHLAKAATTLQKLRGDGWECTVALYDVFCIPPRAMSRAEIEKRLGQMSIAVSEDVYFDDDDDAGCDEPEVVSQ